MFVCFLRVMHDEVSDTENIRKNLAIERMIVEGCDILLDTSQTFVRQGERAHTHRYMPTHIRIHLHIHDTNHCLCNSISHIHLSGLVVRLSSP